MESIKRLLRVALLHFNRGNDKDKSINIIPQIKRYRMRALFLKYSYSYERQVLHEILSEFTHSFPLIISPCLDSQFSVPTSFSFFGSFSPPLFSTLDSLNIQFNIPLTSLC